ncbi:MAG: beta strand repeat-containing protein [Gemmatimonadales bacterium]
MRRPWDVMYPAGVDVVLGGHRHFYERIAPMKPDGTADPATGIREFIVGSGGIGGGNVSGAFPLSEVRNGTTFGVLKLYLYDDSYAWKFIPKVGQTFTDSGSTACHGPPGSGGSGVSASQSTVAASPASFTAGSGSSTVTVTANNSSGTPVSGATVVLSATGTGNTFTPSSGTTDGTGVFTSTFTSTGAGAKTISATAGGTGIIQTAPVTVTAGPVSASQSTVSASPTSFVAGSGSSTITATAKDAFGNPISGATVVLAASGTGNTLTQPSGLTNSSGVATGSLASSVAELKTVSATISGTAITPTAAVNVTPAGSGGGTITHALLTAGSHATNLNNYTTASIAPAPNALITVAVRNHRTPAANSPTLSGGGMTSWTPVTSVDYDPVSGSLGRLTVFRAMSAAPGSGPLTITFSGSVSNVDWIVSQWTGVDQSGTNGSGAIGQTGSARGDLVTALSVPLAAFGNANNVAYGVVGARLNAPAITPGSGFTEIAEVTPGESTLLEAQWATNLNTIQASIASAKNAALLGIEIMAGGGGAPTVSASQSLVSASSPIAAGSGTSNITVTVKDGGGNAMSGVTVTLSATGSGNSITQPAGPTDGSGVATGTMTSTGAGAKTITAVAGGVTLNQQPVVTVFAGPPDADQSTVVASPTSIEQTTGTSTVTVTVRDQYGNPVNGSAVVLAASGTGNTIGQPGPTNSSGVTGGTLSSSDLQTETVNATAGGVLLTQQPSITITPPVPTVSASLSTVVANTPSFTAGGSSDITVTVRDGSNNPMSGVTVTLSATGSGNTITQPSPTDVNGLTTGTLASTGAGSKTVTAVAGGVTLNQQPVVTVNAGSPDAGQSTVAASPSSIPVSTGTSNITVTVKDAFGNPVNGSSVVLAATGTGNTLSGGGLTNPSGVATGTISSTDAESKTVSATADGTPITQTATVTVTPPGSGITHTLLTVGTNIVNTTVYTTAPISPAPNALITVAVLSHRTYGATTVTVSGGGMASWTQVASVTFDTFGTPLRRLTIFRAMSASPGSGPLTITFAGNVSNTQWIVSQWTGVETSGVNGAGAIVQTGSAAADAVNGLTTTLAAFGNANNVAYGVFGVNSNALAITPGAGFTELAEQPSGENTPGDLFAEWATNISAITATWTTKNAGGLGLEIKAAP